MYSRNHNEPSIQTLWCFNTLLGFLATSAILLVLYNYCKGAKQVRVGVGITGASGIPLALHFIDKSLELGLEIEVALSPSAITVAKVEPCTLDLKPCDLIKVLRKKGVKVDISMTSKLASSSNVPDAVVIIPASMKTISYIAHGIAETLPSRLALNALRMGRPLVLVPRETPLGSIELENLLKVSKIGAKIVMPIIAFYTKPKSIIDLMNFVVGKVFDILNVGHDLYTRYYGI